MHACVPWRDENIEQDLKSDLKTITSSYSRWRYHTCPGGHDPACCRYTMLNTGQPPAVGLVFSVSSGKYSPRKSSRVNFFVLPLISHRQHHIIQYWSGRPHVRVLAKRPLQFGEPVLGYKRHGMRCLTIPLNISYVLRCDRVMISIRQAKPCSLRYCWA